MSFPINYELRNKMIGFLEREKFPAIISRERILDGLFPGNEAKHKRGRDDPFVRKTRQQISRHMITLGYTLHCQSDKNRVFRKLEVK